MQFRVCSILVTLLLAVGVAAPAAAKDKKKKKSEDAGESASASASEDGEAGDDEDGDYEEPDGWERPPMEAEKPADAAPAPAPLEKKAGDGKPIMVGAVLGWGFKTDRATGGLGADPYGLALGVMGGYTLDFQLYVGLRYMYFLGSTESSTGGRPPVPGESSTNYMQIVAEAGYDLWAAGLLIRPSLLIGGAMALWEHTGPSGTQSDVVGDFMLGPGFSLNYPFDDFFIGGDLRGNLVMGDGVSGVGLHVVGGARFE